MRNDCTVVELSEHNEADDEEAIRRRNWSYASGVGVAQPRSELYVRSRSWKWVVPLHPSVKLSTSQSPSTSAQYAAMRHIPYHEAVGSSMYAMLGTHPDISFANTVVSKFASNPGMAHWEAVKRIYRYLSGTKDL